MVSEVLLKSLEEVNPELQLEDLIRDPRIYPSKTKRSADRLFIGLKKLGLDFTESYEMGIINMPSREFGPIKENRANFKILLYGLSLPIPSSSYGSNGGDLVDDYTPGGIGFSGYSIDAIMLIDEQIINTHLSVTPRINEHKLILHYPTKLDLHGPTLLTSLPQSFTSIGVRYELSNPNVKDFLSTIAQSRISSSYVDSKIRSLVEGQKTQKGYHTGVRLNLQDPSPNYSDCYEAEVFSNGKKIDSTRLVPEAVWQENQNHYCINKPDIPRIPVTMDEVSILSLIIDYNGNSSILNDLFGDLPLSFDGTNQWFAKRSFVRGDLELLFKPEWGENNTSLVYTQHSEKRITPKQIYEAVEGMLNVKNTLTERLTK